MRAEALALFAILLMPRLFADDLDMIADVKTSSYERGEAYQRASEQDFFSDATKLATLIGHHPVMSGVGPGSSPPWSSPRLSLYDQIGATLGQLWQVQIKAVQDHARLEPVMISLLKTPAVGEGRYLARGEIARSLEVSDRFNDPATRERILHEIDPIARSEAEPAFALSLLGLLFQYGNPNDYLSSIVDQANRLPPEKYDAPELLPMRRSEVFRFATPPVAVNRLDAQHRAEYLRHGFDLLQQIDDGKQGNGYFLALHLGSILGIPGEFAPDDSQLAKYNNVNGRSELYFQQTVNNAFLWWSKNRVNFE